MTDRSLRVGVYRPVELPQSFRVYADNVERYFPELGIEAVHFDSKTAVPRSVDVLWDIRSGGGNPPLEFLLDSKIPLVMTVHGFAPISLSGWEYFQTIKGALLSKKYARDKLKRWQELKDGVAAMIAVSQFTKEEAVRLTGMPEHKIIVCPHGVSPEFGVQEPAQPKDNYFLHISNNEPRKNVVRIVEAFQRLKKTRDVRLKLKLPRAEGSKYQYIEGVELIQGMLSTQELVELYQKASGFVFPSLYEGFGMPILEAMACGCPVITSNVSACPEVAWEAAIIIDPRNVQALQNAMEQLIDQTRDIGQSFITAGLQRAAQFDWKKSAEGHAETLIRANQTTHG